MKLEGNMLLEMIREARGYVELFLEDLEHEEPILEKPQDMLFHIIATLDFAETTLTSC